jgi:hypothetical protein
MVMVSVTTGMVFFLFICMNFGCGRFYEGSSRVRRPSVKRFAMSESLKSTGIIYMQLKNI